MNVSSIFNNIYLFFKRKITIPIIRFYFFYVHEILIKKYICVSFSRITRVDIKPDPYPQHHNAFTLLQQCSHLQHLRFDTFAMHYTHTYIYVHTHSQI